MNKFNKTLILNSQEDQTNMDQSNMANIINNLPSNPQSCIVEFSEVILDDKAFEDTIENLLMTHDLIESFPPTISDCVLSENEIDYAAILNEVAVANNICIYVNHIPFSMVELAIVFLYEDFNEAVTIFITSIFDYVNLVEALNDYKQIKNILGGYLNKKENISPPSDLTS